MSLWHTNDIDVHGNNITDNLEFGIRFEGGCNSTEVYNNNIVRNEVGILLDNFVFVSFSQIGSGNKIYYNRLIENAQNAFVNRRYPYNISRIDNAIGNGTDVVLWDNCSMGNYWSDYSAKYPNATEIGGSGISDTPYVVNANNQDNYPLWSPAEISDSSPKKPFPTTLVATLSATFVIVMCIGLLIYFKKRKH